jgi:DMSO/TMAO reductase YedYZ molybdopterin-dependent catalytic subunit
VNRGGGRRSRSSAPRVDRRKFLTASAATAGVAAAAGVAGKMLVNKLPATPPPASAAAGSVPTAGASTAAPAPDFALPKVEEPVLPQGAELNTPNISPFYTSNADFYRVDTTFNVPRIDSKNWQLRIHGMVDKPLTINFDELLRRPMFDHDITLTCVAESIGGTLVGNARWEGTMLADLLREAGVQSGADQIVMTDVQGMNISVATDPVMDGRAAMLAIGMNGQPLPAEHGYPVRVVVPGLYGYVSACKWVVDMELTTYQAFSTYWTRRNWAEQAPVKTESRIDTPKTGARLAPGQSVIAGVAWAQHRGIEAVEVHVDGAWHEATLAAQDTIDTWRQWYYPWNATTGGHRITVRATDKTGYTQTSVKHGSLPNGATGLHTIQITVT